MTTITKGQLLDMARSNDAATRQQALAIYRAWVNAAARLHPQDQLNAMERGIFVQLFQKHGMLKK